MPEPASTAPQSVDLVVEPEWLLPMDGERRVLTGHAVAVAKGVIVAVDTTQAVQQQFRAEHQLKLPGQLLMPGLINLHCHAAMTLLRGFADDLPLKRWLEEKIWPAEAAFADANFVRDGTELACEEMLLGGTTCFNDMYFYPGAAAEAVLHTGIRAAIGMVVIDFPTRYASDRTDYLEHGLEVRERHRHADLLSFCLAPHAPYTVGDETFAVVTDLAQQLGLPIHIHVHETQKELDESLAQHGVRPWARLARLGVLGPQTLAVHAVHLSPDEIAQAADLQVSLVHCPTSNLKLGSDIARLAAWEEAQLNWALGTDGAASNNRLDLWQEMRLAALLAKGSSGNAAAVASWAVLEAATTNAARALGLGNTIGALAPGLSADMISVRLDEMETQPVFDPVSHLVYVCGREQVTHVWVHGQLRVEDRRLRCTNPTNLRQRVAAWRDRLGTP